MTNRTTLFLTAIATVMLVTSVQAQQQRGQRSGYGSNKGGVLSDTPLPDVNAYTADGKDLKLRELCKGKFTVLATGCLTCPEFHRGYPEIEAANKDYASKGVQFFYVYKSLRHPELNGYVEAQNKQERLLQLVEARKMLGTTVPWIADTIDNSVREGLKSGSRSVYLISPEGQIVFAHSKPQRADIRDALAKFVGDVDKPTVASDLNLPQLPRRLKSANFASDIRVVRPEGMTILAQSPKNPLETYYVKLRAEADQDLLRTGKGKLFLGFYPDPIHGVHWNNLTKPMKFTLTLPEGAKATPAQASAAKGPGDKDTEPRQFWVTVDSDRPLKSIELAMHYFGCTDSMCKALTHEYTIELKDADMGSSTYGFNRGPGGRGQQGGNRQGRENRGGNQQAQQN